MSDTLVVSFVGGTHKVKCMTFTTGDWYDRYLRTFQALA